GKRQRFHGDPLGGGNRPRMHEGHVGRVGPRCREKRAGSMTLRVNPWPRTVMRAKKTRPPPEGSGGRGRRGPALTVQASRDQPSAASPLRLRSTKSPSRGSWHIWKSTYPTSCAWRGLQRG